MRQTINGWLKAGVLVDGTWQPTERGSPQGGVVSPLLALVALHGLETAITTAFRHADSPHVVVCADDFVLLHPTRAGVERARQIAEGWLGGIGLQLKASKTRIGHTRHAIDGQIGFDFLGFSIRHYPTRHRVLVPTAASVSADHQQGRHPAQATAGEVCLVWIALHGED